MNITCVLIHGSALTAHASKRDVDVIFSGDRTEATTIARAWADEHGCAGLPLDIHESDRGTRPDGTVFFSVPSVPGNGAPYEVISGQPEVFVREYTGLASLLRMRATASVIAAAIRAQGRARIALVGQNDEWGNYVDGAVALRSAIRHAAQNGVWEGLCVEVPGVTRLAETVAEFGVGRLSKQTIDQIGRGGGWVDVSFRGCSTGSITVGTHAREGDAWWAAPVYLAEDIERGERPLGVDAAEGVMATLGLSEEVASRYTPPRAKVRDGVGCVPYGKDAVRQEQPRLALRGLDRRVVARAAEPHVRSDASAVVADRVRRLVLDHAQRLADHGDERVDAVVVRDEHDLHRT
jgi:hypothetical protein